MRGILFIVALTVVFAMPASEATFTDFVKGVLKGISESGDINGLKGCIKDGDAIIEKIKSALDDIRTIDPEVLKVGLPKLIDATKETLEMLKPCSASYNGLKKLETEIAHADLLKLIRRVQSSAGSFFHLCINALEAFLSNDFVAAGEAVGTIEKMLFLSRAEDGAVIMPGFVKGILLSIGENADPKGLDNCIKESEPAIDSIKEALSNIKTMIPDDVKKGAKMLLDGVTIIMEMLKPCLEGFNVLKRLISGLSHADVQKMVRVMMSSPGAFFHLSIDGLEGFLNENYVDAGKAVGTMLKMLFLQARLDNSFFDFVKGFLKGINESGDINKLLECLEGGEEIMAKILEALEYLLKMDAENIMKGLMLLVEAVKELSAKFQPCAEGFHQIEKLVKELVNLDFMKVVMRILSNPAPILHDILDCIDMLKRGFYEKAGKDLGDLLYRIFLSK